MLLVDSAKTKVYIGTRVGAENHNIFCSGQFGVLLSCAIAFELRPNGVGSGGEL